MPAVTALLLLVLAVAVVGSLMLITRNATLVCALSVHNGKVLHVRGHAPKRLVHDIGEVVSVRPVSSARIRVVSRSGTAAVEASGDLSEHELQRIRNVVGTWPLAMIRSAPPRRT